jgi:hypothetical protein
VSVMGECDLEGIGAPSIFKAIRIDTVSVRMLTILDLSCEETPHGGSGTDTGRLHKLKS